MTAPSASAPPAGTHAAPALSPIKQALLEIRELRARVASMEGAASEPVAIVGLGCRLPGGVHDEASLWRVLAEGVDTIGPIPASRWDVPAHHDDDPDHPGTMWTHSGGFLAEDVAGFDAAFFGIAPLEAASMDPQQRLMLELAWHALEDAGIAPDSLAGSRTGVFVGVGNGDYGRMLFGEPTQIDAYGGTGGSLAVVAGRLSYALGLQGPAMVVDTACSASLVALHLACQSLRSGECDMALVGGINLMLSPAAHISFTKARMMARDGRCKTFDAGADGYGRGEGAVMLVLQRQRTAEDAGARVLARIRGSAVNQDGRSSGLTAPNGPAQEAVIRAALAQAHLAGSDIDYVEAHGTGTPLGDPIELQALAHALGEGRSPQEPLFVGSCKTNFGHLEAAAGLLGVAKVVASLRRRQLPAHLHFTKPNPLFDWAHAPLAVPTSLQPWPDRGRPARAGVSSFGFSGTNAHVVIEEAAPASSTVPAAPALQAPAEEPQVLALSARDDESLRVLAQRWQAHLEAPEAAAGAADLCFTAATGRAQLAQRLTVQGRDAPALARGLAGWLAGEGPDEAVAGRAAATPPKVAFVFTGQGAQHSGMGQALYRRSAVFRHSIDRSAQVLQGLLDVPLAELLFDARHAARLDDTAFAQPALFAFEVALAELWQALGVSPAVVLGHSLGEYAAACVAGIFPLEDALRVLVRRGQLAQALPGEGAMVSVPAGEAALRAELAGLGLEPGREIDFAAFNGAQQTVLSGTRAAIDRLTAHLDAKAQPWRALRISHGFHSPLVEPALAPLGEALATVPFGAEARCAIVDNLHGELAAPGALATPLYWQQQMRAPVQFAKAMRTLRATGVTHVVEIGPHPVLLALAAEQDAAQADGAARAPVAWLPSARRGDAGTLDLVQSLQQLYAAGLRVRWTALDEGWARQRRTAPLMPFKHRRHWIDRPGPPAVAAPAAATAPAWPRVAAALARQSDQAPIGVNVQGYAERWAVLERLTVAHAAQVLRDAGVFTQAGEALTLHEVRARLGAKETYDHLLSRWLDRLVGRGELRRDGVRWMADAALPDPQLSACEAAARAALADNPAQLDYMLHCGRLLPEVIRGRESPLETLFPGGSFELAEGIYQRSTPMRYINTLAASAVEALLAARGGAPLRVLEIGAGTGSTTAALMPVFAAAAGGGSRIDYCYTDVTPVFFELARTKFAAIPFVRFAEFDLERDAAAQGFAAGGFDLVFAANAVHAVRDLRAALASIRALLAPGGLLLLVESTEHLAWYDMTTGLIEGWQHFADDLRGDNPLLHTAQWTRALREAGFDEAGAWPPQGHEAAALGQSVVAAWVAPGQAATPRAATVGPAATGEAPPAPATAAPAASAEAASPANGDSAAPALAAWRAQLAAATPDEQRELLRDAVRDSVCRVLRLPPDQAPARHDRLMDLGMDSLMAVQLRNRFGQMLGLARALPATLLFDHPTIEALALHLQPLAGPGAGTSATPTAPAAPEAIGAPASRAAPEAPAPVPLGAVRVAELSDEEVERLLLEKLDAPRR